MLVTNRKIRFYKFIIMMLTMFSITLYTVNIIQYNKIKKYEEFDKELNSQEIILNSPSLNKVQTKFLLNISKLLQYAEDLGFGQDGLYITGGELYRTKYQQARYIKTGRSKTWNSNHLKRLAIDLHIIKDGKLDYKCEEYKMLGEYWESLDPKNKWGGNYRSWKDYPHLEYRY